MKHQLAQVALINREFLSLIFLSVSAEANCLQYCDLALQIVTNRTKKKQKTSHKFLKHFPRMISSPDIRSRLFSFATRCRESERIKLGSLAYKTDLKTSDVDNSILLCCWMDGSFSLNKDKKAFEGSSEVKWIHFALTTTLIPESKIFL